MLKHGAPRELLSDNGPAFISDVLDQVCKTAGTLKLFTTNYRPQANGMVERWNGTIAQSITASTTEFKEDWDLKLPWLTFAYNSAPHAATRYSPFELVYGRKAVLPLEMAMGANRRDQQVPVAYHNELLINMQEALRLARDSSDKLKRAMERRAQGGEVKMAVSELVLLEKMMGKSKFGDKYEGPFKIVKLHGPNYVTLELEDGSKEKVHVSRVKKFKERDEGQEAEDVAESEAVEDLDMEEVEEDPTADMLPNDLINRRVRVWWPLEKKWFDGLVKKRVKRRHEVEYDDGDVRREPLLGFKANAGVKWKLLVRRGSNASNKEGSVTKGSSE